jgi:hypothetical protein
MSIISDKILNELSDEVDKILRNASSHWEGYIIFDLPYELSDIFNAIEDVIATYTVFCGVHEGKLILICPGQGMYVDDIWWSATGENTPNTNHK